MVAETARSGPGWTIVRTVVDALAYAVVVAVGTVALSLVAGIAIGGSLTSTKLVLFLAGWLLMAIATVRLWPKSPKQVATEEVAGPPPAPSAPAGDTRIEAVADALPPLRWMRPPTRRLSPPTKLFVGSLLVLLASFLLEVVFAVE